MSWGFRSGKKRGDERDTVASVQGSIGENYIPQLNQVRNTTTVGRYLCTPMRTVGAGTV